MFENLRETLIAFKLDNGLTWKEFFKLLFEVLAYLYEFETESE